MNKSYTSKLFHKKFPYKIVFYRVDSIPDKTWSSEWNPTKFKKWLDKNNIEFRLNTRVRVAKRTRQVKIKMVVFLHDKKWYDTCLKKHKKYIESVTEPYINGHIDLLKDNTTIIIREQLLYNRYRYVVNFRRTWQQDVADITAWIKDTFKNSLYSKELVKVVLTGWNPRIYLKNQEDLVLIKLTWGERIRTITSVVLISDDYSNTTIR